MEKVTKVTNLWYTDSNIMDKINYFNDSKDREKEYIKYNVEEKILRNNVQLYVRTSKYATCVSDWRHVCLI